jgi:hypothetical protein
MDKHFPPVYKKANFHCPLCNVYAQQSWGDGYYLLFSSYKLFRELDISICAHCEGRSLWIREKLIHPDKSIAPNPHDDMPTELLDDYLEASSIINKSPRGSAALLRLALQKLMIVLGEPGKDINKDIGSLVSKGLHPQVQQALDIVRVIGNEAVHPGQLNLKDDTETAIKLFGLINFIVEDRITRPKTIEDLFNKLPEAKLKGIEDRDRVKTP